ncbi:MAG: DUF362 domain-containing protein [Promethearchaeota archaeon]|nr:MAG: DUF362 domain-containing protein [Candidatus Lokiarchaeota archaeon]
MDKSKVAIVSIDNNIQNSVKNAIETIGGIKKYIPKRKLLIKINGVHFTDYSYTDPRVLDAVLKIFIENGLQASDIYVIESCTSGLYTRMVFKISGLAEVCKENKVNIIYMDEGEKEKIKLGKEKYEVEISKFVYDEIINQENRKDNIYIEIPKFKTHWCTKVTLGIKLQLGFLRDVSKAFKHHHYHEERLVDIFEAIRPDLCIIDGINGIAIGPCPPQNPDIINDYVYDYNLILASDDIVAIDAVGAMLLGLENLEVPTTKIAHERGLGVGDIEKIDIITTPDMEIDSLIQKVPWELKKAFPDNVDILYGKELACYEGCVGLTLVYLELLTLENPDLKENASFTLLFGKGFEKEDLKELKEPICLVGSCCVEELGDYIKSNYDQVHEVNLCGNLGQYTNILFTVTGIDPLSQVPTDKFTLPELLLGYTIAKSNNLEASLPDLPTVPQILDLISSSISSIPDEVLKDPEFQETIKKLMDDSDTKIRSNSTKIAIEMANLYNHNWIELVNKALSDESKKVLKTTLKKLSKSGKKNTDLIKKLRTSIETIISKNEDKKIKKLGMKILGLIE